jgi:hypothetical protein
MAFDPTAFGTEWQPAFASIESLVGGRIVGGERQTRWRPVFFVDVEMPSGEILPICFRGGRIELEDDSAIRHEYECFRALEKNGILVPHIYGYCEKPAGFVMQKSPGRHDMATTSGPDELASVRDHFIEILAEIHRVPTADFEAFGLKRAETPRDLALGDSKPSIKRFQKLKSRPEPGVEFLIDWTERNIPQDRTECCFVTGDSGQFIFDEGRVTAMLDMELGYLGDPLADLGGFFSRDLTEKMGDIEVAIEKYEAVTGKPVDRRVVLYHAIRFAMTTPLGTALAVANPPVAAEYIQYLAWYLVYLRNPLQLIAHLEGFEVDSPDIDFQETISPYAPGHDQLQDRFEIFRTHDDFQAYEADGLRRLALYLKQGDRFGADVFERDLDDVEKLLGRRPKTWQERDLALEAFVQEAKGERNEEFVRYYVRRLRREEALLAPAMRDLVGVDMQTLKVK